MLESGTALRAGVGCIATRTGGADSFKEWAIRAQRENLHIPRAGDEGQGSSADDRRRFDTIGRYVSSMERIEIPQRATYSPVALTDVIVGAPIASRVLLGAVFPGQVVSATFLGLYVGSAAMDYVAKYGIRPIDFAASFDADVTRLDPMPQEAREWEIRLLGNAMNEGFTREVIPRDVLAPLVDQHLTDFIAGITDQEIVTSNEIRNFNLARLVFPFAQGTCDAVSGDVAIFGDTGMFEAHVIAHEFSHRKGYLKELHAQVLSFMALRVSDNPVLVQAARAERLGRQLAVASGGDEVRFMQLLELACLIPELYGSFASMRPGPAGSALTRGMRAMYDQRMKLTGQNGLSDYDEGFTNFLWTFTNSDVAPMPKDYAAV